MFARLLSDLRYATRTLAKRPGFSATVILTLGLGIGANTAIFSVVDAALLRGLPYQNPDRIIHLWERGETNAPSQREASYPDFLDWKTNNKTFESMAGYGEAGLILNGRDSSDFLMAGRVSADFFQVLGVQPALGRGFDKGDDDRGANGVALISQQSWKKRFGSDENIVGKIISLNGAPFTVAGVLPETFYFAPLGGAEIFVPLNPPQEIRERRFMHFVRVIGKLKDGVSIEQAQQDMNVVGSQISQLDPKFHANSGIKLINLRDQIVGDVKGILVVLLVAVSFVLLIACANVANLFLVRSAARQKELAVRVALGAGRLALARQLLVESLLLSAVGGIIGVALGRWGVNFLLRSIPTEQLIRMPYLQNLGMNRTVLSYTLLLSVLSGLIFALVPLFQMRQTGFHSVLKDGGRRTAGTVRARLRNGLVAAEIALTVMLTVGVGLMLKSTARLLNVNPGFDSANLLTMRLALVGPGYESPQQLVAFQKQLVERVASLPGVRSAGTTGKLPLSGGGNTGTPIIDGNQVEAEGKGPDTNLRTVGSTYFQTIGVPLVVGRLFSDQDTIDSPRAIVVNQRFVREYFAQRDPLGHRISFVFDAKPWNIIGIVGDENVNTLAADVTPVIYFPYAQDPESLLNLVVRTSAEPGVFVGAIREEIRQLDHSLPVFAVSSMADLIEDAPSTFARRYPALLLGIFAALAMLLAAVGLYGVISYSVSQRTQELGVRIALGAQRRDIFKLVLGQGLLVTVVGVAIGLAASFVLTRFLSSLLFQVSPNDPMVIAAVVPLMIAVALAACYFPTRRAAKVDPLVALRYE